MNDESAQDSRVLDTLKTLLDDLAGTRTWKLKSDMELKGDDGGTQLETARAPDKRKRRLQFLTKE